MSNDDWVILAEFENVPSQIVRGGYRTMREAGAVRTEMEVDPPRYADTTNLLLMMRSEAKTRMRKARK